MMKMRVVPINPAEFTPQSVLGAFIGLCTKGASPQRFDCSIAAMPRPFCPLMSSEHFLAQIQQRGELAFRMAGFLKVQNQGAV
jgi:hypothetical protein